jgi:hypothetical protein
VVLVGINLLQHGAGNADISGSPMGGTGNSFSSAKPNRSAAPDSITGTHWKALMAERGKTGVSMSPAD